jgi:hypothetical protein
LLIVLSVTVLVAAEILRRRSDAALGEQEHSR